MKCQNCNSDKAEERAMGNHETAKLCIDCYLQAQDEAEIEEKGYDKWDNDEPSL